MKIHFPAISNDLVSASLRDLTEALQRVTGEGPMGVLGGESGYGVNWDNNVFTMRQFYWGDCDCGHEQRCEEWCKQNPALHEGHDEFGDCLKGCEWWDRYYEFEKTVDHDYEKCSVYLPNFVFKPTGASVSWYKYIGRGMEVDGDLPRDFLAVCLDSLVVE